MLRKHLFHRGPVEGRVVNHHGTSKFSDKARAYLGNVGAVATIDVILMLPDVVWPNGSNLAD